MSRVIDISKLGRRLNEARTRRGLTIRQLADMIAVEKGSLANIESGNAAPSVELLFSLANALEVPMDYLVADSLKNKRVAVDYMINDILAGAPPETRSKLIAMMTALVGITTSPSSE